MPKHDPYKTDRKTQNAERVDKFLGRKSGGRVKDDDGTNIHIEINAADKKEQGAVDGPPVAGPPPPPPPPPMMPPLAPPGPGGPVGGGGPGPLGLKRGGAAKSSADMTAGAASGPGRGEKTAITKVQRPKS